MTKRTVRKFRLEVVSNPRPLDVIASTAEKVWHTVSFSDCELLPFGEKLKVAWIKNISSERSKTRGGTTIVWYLPLEAKFVISVRMLIANFFKNQFKRNQPIPNFGTEKIYEEKVYQDLHYSDKRY